MRLICPNCDAHYEVESRLIPENGRDVQCSSCGDTWFQAPETEGDSAVADLESDIFAENAAQTVGEFDTDDAQAVPSVPQDQEDAFPVAPVTETEADTEEQAPERASLDSALLQVLREEAERETNARVDEGSVSPEIDTDAHSETQSSLQGETADVEEAVRERTARLRGIEPEDLSDGSANARRDLLPDIEEINSTLRATSDRKENEAEESEEAAPRKRSSFSTGFSLIVVLVAALLLVYTFAPQIGAKFPTLDPALKSFVRSADQGRAKLDTLMEGLITKINSDEAPAE